MTLAQQFDPRRHLAAAIGWAVFVVVTLAALMAANLAAIEAAHRIRSDTERLFGQFATQVQQALETNMQTRRSIVQATAAQIVASSDRGTDALRRHLEAVQAQFPEFIWLGVADDRGRIVAATGGQSQGENVASREWFIRGRQHLYLGEVHTVTDRKDGSHAIVSSPTERIVTVAVPLTRLEGHNVGVLVARLSWSWVEKLQADLVQALDSHRQLELLLIGEDGALLTGPDASYGSKFATDQGDAGDYVVGRSQAPVRGAGGFGWTVVVRQASATALVAARTTRNEVFLVVLLAGLITAGAAVLVTRMLTRRLATLADDAESVRRGMKRTLSVPPGADEISRIAETLAEAMDHLQQEKQALLALNSELDDRVVERTARIERLGEEARHAAVARERLRLARDLHDTLAHSLMALLTQIRLVRKLRHRLDDDELDAELGRAEDVTASGLSAARGAITQMRHNAVREAGLGAALQELLCRFGSRTGVASMLNADPTASGLADERAETVFRIVEEALNNVERHAQARHVTVDMKCTRMPGVGASDRSLHSLTHIHVEIVDDGIGFDPSLQKSGHFGLSGIYEHAAMIPGQFHVHSQPGDGTRLVLEFDA